MILTDVQQFIKIEHLPNLLQPLKEYVAKGIRLRMG